MLLRASGDNDGVDYDTSAVTADGVDSGVESGECLRTLTDALIGGDEKALDERRADAEAEMGAQETTDALAVAAAFNGITRVADATGIPLDDSTEQGTVDLRATVGIDEFAYSAKSSRYS